MSDLLGPKGKDSIYFCVERDDICAGGGAPSHRCYRLPYK